MSRHRNVRSMNYNEEYDTYYDVYGQSVEDELCISPSTAAEFMYNRDGKPHSMSSYLAPEGSQDILEEDESSESIDDQEQSRQRSESVSEYPKTLNEVDEAKLRSCVEEMQNVVGETVSEGTLIKVAMECHFNLEKALDYVLSQAVNNQQARPQRPKRERTADLVSFDLKPKSPYFAHQSSNSLLKNKNKFEIETYVSDRAGPSDNLNDFIKKFASKNSNKTTDLLTNESLNQPNNDTLFNMNFIPSKNKNNFLSKSIVKFGAPQNKKASAFDLKKLATSNTKVTNTVQDKPYNSGGTLSLADLAERETLSDSYLKISNANLNSSQSKPFSAFGTLSLADLAKQETPPRSNLKISKQSGNFEHASFNIGDSISLADLAKQETNTYIKLPVKNERIKFNSNFAKTSNSVPGLSLLDLAKEHLESVEQSKTLFLFNDSPISSPRSEPNKEVPLNYHNDVKYHGWTTTKHDISINTIDKNLNICMDISKIYQITKKPSVFGFILCMKYRFQKPPSLTILKHLKEQNKVVAFDFSTLSPDDIVKEKQFQAFRDAVKPSVLEDTPEPEKEASEASIITPQEDKEKLEETTSLPAVTITSVNLLTPGKPNRSKSRSPSPSGGNENEPTPGRKQRGGETNPEEAYTRERMSGKPLINLVVIGHVDAGKSTLMGHLLYNLGCVNKKVMHKNEQDSKKLGKSSFMYAWVLDETPEERNRGITMDIAQSKFETKQRLVTLLDAPGHKDFIPNMITGAAQADVAILVVDATRGEFETGFETGGQTREHALLVRSLGVSQLAVAVNKLDNVDWSKERYDEIVSKMTAFLKQAGYKEKDACFVPCSGLTGENLNELSKSCPLSSWYSGPALVDVIDNFKPPERPINKPFRMCISDIFKGLGAGFCVGGRVEAGHIENGSKVLVLPAGEQATVKGITIDDVGQSQAFAGDHLTLSLSGVDMNKVMIGDVICDQYKPVKVSTRFRARIVVFNIDSPLTQGFPVVLHYQSMSEQAVVRKLITQLNKSTGEVIKKKPRFLLKNSSGVIELEVVRPICIELYKENRDLGRFMLRSAGTTVAAGLVTEAM